MSREFRRYSIRFDENKYGEAVYELNKDSHGCTRHLYTSCGNGSDATCELTLKNACGGPGFHFSLPDSIRIVMVDGNPYIITGVTLKGPHGANINDMMVYKIEDAEINLICGNERN